MYNTIEEAEAYFLSKYYRSPSDLMDTIRWHYSTDYHFKELYESLIEDLKQDLNKYYLLTLGIRDDNT